MQILSSPKPRFLALAISAPFLLWIVVMAGIQLELLSLSNFDLENRAWTAGHWAVLMPLCIALILGIAYLAGLLNVSRLMTVCVLLIAILVPTVFLAFDVVSLMVPVVAWLGEFPVLVILIVHYRRIDLAFGSGA